MDIRHEYLNFFASKGHEIIPSAPLVPNDATLLFTNAGMVPFKSIFTGDEPRPTPPIRTSAQTCIRAGGKHNDLDNVGYTARHHTFFEMLGNFSFGEYFKREAIAYAWEFVTQVLKLPKERLYVTVHESDDEAFGLWCEHIASERIYRFGDKDNFWQMGDTGPCGPCSEIFYDQGSEHFNSPEDYMGGDGDRFLEIWNLVFMQYERNEKGELSPLPKPSIDTGMGLERVTAIMEGKFSNYDSSLFMPIIDEIAKICAKPYEYESGASYRVIADHIRSTTFLLAQGVSFDKEGRGYVLRRILRRAVRHGYLLGIKEPFMYRLVDRLCEIMAGAYPYLLEKKEFVKQMVKLEEERFFATLAAGIELFNKELESTSGEIFSGEVAFKLYDTYGFPLDLTSDMLRERNMRVDEAKFDELMNEQKRRAKAAWVGSGDGASASGDFKLLLEEFGENEFIGYESLVSEAKVLGLLDAEYKKVQSLGANQSGWVMLDRTPFYATSGGQAGDRGELAGVASVVDTQKFFGLNLSKIDTKTEIKVGQAVTARVGCERAQIARHHSATHLLHAALRAVLGEHITQAGSSVESDRLRFDFTHPKALSGDELSRIESFVRAEVAAAADTLVEIMDLESAKNSGAVALFGEKYAENVRVLSIGASKELCGGTHVANTAEVGAFFIVKESGVSAGVRRIEAVCANAAIKYADELRSELAGLYAEIKNTDLLAGVRKLKGEIKALKDELKQAASSASVAGEKVGETLVFVGEFGGDIKAKIDELKNQHDSVVVMLFKSSDDKVQVAAGVKGAGLKAGELVKFAAGILGGGGGGRDDFATAGGKDASKLGEAMAAAKELIKTKLA
ncbi:alanine--tRNA ligase [Campylobacter sp. 19-13652]|uniref:alanine--tRNA ligase n=1 Tax=Campylobacter sp. 19-13652 TaxID=2840180 RepID=UPI001C782929|nr:alanine--tRNA ligase [Campylobacter sp. 19-13652]BCX79306.1 alanine--tRNA ligase [Campylobacter sp. 19-13652]